MKTKTINHLLSAQQSIAVVVAVGMIEMEDEKALRHLLRILPRIIERAEKSDFKEFSGSLTL